MGRRAASAGRSCPPMRARASIASVEIDAATLVPMVTYGTHPGMVAPITGNVPAQGDAVFQKALAYMGLKAGEPINNVPVNIVFVGSCTNGRLSDLRNAARVLRGHKLAAGREDAGGARARRTSSAPPRPKACDQIFLDAGAEWRESGCSMCLGMNGDLVPAGQYSISTSNRNFEGRQGVGARTLLASPETAAASAIRGRVTDPREFTVQLICPPYKPSVPAPSCCPPPTSTPTRSFRRAFSPRLRAAGFGKHLFADWRYEPDGQPEAGFRAQPARGAGRRDSRRRSQHRLRLFARARGLGAAGFRHPRRDQHRVRRHLSHQLPEERPGARCSSTRRPTRWLLAQPGRRGDHRRGAAAR